MVALTGEDRTTLQMNTSILNKCLTELTKENPSLDYVRGMLETLIDLQTPSITVPSFAAKPVAQPPHPTAVTLDEAAILDAQARKSLEHIKALSAASQQ